jgi:hypothetical protein
MSEDTNHDSIQTWLQSAEGLAEVGKAANSIVNKVVCNHIPLVFAGIQDPVAADRSELSEVIESELLIFILENRASLQKKLSIPEIKRDTVLTREFLKYLSDKARIKEVDPVRYLYKHAADVLRNRKKPRETTADVVLAPDYFHTDSIRSKKGAAVGTRFSLAGKAKSEGALDDSTVDAVKPIHHDMERIVWEDTLARMDADSEFGFVFKKDVLMHLAIHFWIWVSTITANRKIAIDLRDFIHWIDRLFCLVKNTRTYLYSLSGFERDPAAVPDRAYFDRKTVSRWAKNFSHLLSDKEGRVLVLRYAEELKPKAVKEKIGVQDSTQNEIFKRIGNKLAQFTIDLKWLSPDDRQEANPRAREYFMDTLVEILKTRSSTP